ncbi:RNA-directed DNA polymerase [Arthrobacter dokdonensis]|uniref:RNA-directed DNA polymerase n=1 Tax=Arthrobacter dokdonellae TaxID=2211210 RepID=UPI000DE59713|nr:RNA-directed DNA polymerase [Arthrobacter dokdonellae]
MTASASFRRATTKIQLHNVFQTYVVDNTVIGRDGQLAKAIEGEWDAVASLLSRKMRDGTYEFTSYREILISKGAQSRPRVVSVATARDRIALKALAGVIVEVFPEAKTPLAQVKVGELAFELKRTKFDSFVRIDVQNFYPSISHRAIQSRLERKLRQPRLRNLITRAISTPTVSVKSPRPNFSSIIGVPQGLPISNLLAEIAMADIDLALRGNIHATYFRYVDDILLLCNGVDAKSLFEDVKARCASIGLTVHDLKDGSKSEIGRLTDSFDYLGYKFSPRGVTVRRSSIHKLETTVIRLFTSYKYESARMSSPGWADKTAESLLRRLDLVIAGCVFENVPRGWIHYFSQMDDMTLLCRLDSYVSRLVVRFGLPAIFKPKSFVRAYWHVTKPNTSTRRYIPNFDRFTRADEESLLLALYPSMQTGVLDRLSTEELHRKFGSEVRKLVQMLDRDTSQTS